MSAARDTATNLSPRSKVSEGGRASQGPPVLHWHKDGQVTTQREVHGAAPTTVQALMYELRTDGVKALGRPNCQRRLGDLSTIQVREIIERLTRLRARYPAITDELLLTLTDQL